MRIIGRVAYWVVAIAVITTILFSLDYSLEQAVFISLMYCPCALVLEFLMPKAHKPLDKLYLLLAVLFSAILAILVLHGCIWDYVQSGFVNLPSMIINPAFLGVVFAALSLGDYFCYRWLSRRFKDESRTITFFSDRRSVTLPINEIAYIESNDTEVRLITSSGETYRNKTGIGQWENLLGEDFMRIHRSYLVNSSMVHPLDQNSITIGEVTLPVSRKYREAVNGFLSGK